MQIYIDRDGQQFGPYSLEDVRAHLGSGSLQPTDLAWHEGAADWMPLASIPGVGRRTLKISSMPEPSATESVSAHQSEPVKRPRTKAMLVLCMLISGLFSLVCLVATPLLISGSRHTDFPWGTLIGGFLLTITGIAITAQLLVALRSRAPTGVCAHCARRRPTMSAGLNRHIGVIVLFFHKSVTGHLCKQCISKVFWEHMVITFLFGWWGAVSAFVTPVVLVNNAIVYARSRLMRNHE